MLAQTTLDSGFPYPLLMDPDHTVRKSLEIKALAITDLLKPSGAIAYAKSIRSWKQFGIQPSDATNPPGIVILDAEQNVAFTHVGEALGDYPPIETVMAELAKLS